MPVVVVLGVVAVVAIVGFIIVQSGGDRSAQSEEAVEAEANDDPSLPGEYVNVPEIYDGYWGNTGGTNTGEHVRRDVDYEADGNSNPPAGGPHWSGQCGDDPSEAPAFCGPAPWGIYNEPWDPETLVHNMEHAGAVIWYNTADQGVIDDLESIVEDQLNDGKLLVMAPYRDMEAETIALTSWSRIEKFLVGEYSEERVKEFIDVHERRFNPEDF
ncbi:MAG: DUF3105 domain-containing protein [Dehalococcoidia bacterium]